MCDEPDETRWERYDFNRKYELCWCCGLEIIPSGSKFSSFYCRDCKARIWYLNQKLGQCLIPLGRHSVMNGVIGSGKDIGNKEIIDKFCQDIGAMNDRIAFLDEQYKRKKIKEAIDLLNLPEDSRVIDLIKKTKDVDLASLKGVTEHDPDPIVWVKKTNTIDIAHLKEEAFLDLLIEVMTLFIPVRQLSLN